MEKRRSVEDVSKLPLWAQRRLEVQDANIAHLQRELLEATGASEQKTDTFVEVDGVLRSLPRGTRVYFNLGPPGGDEKSENWITIHRESKGFLVVMATDDALRVQPNSSNVLHLWAAEWIG